jgi:hypothetical protein
MPTINKISPDGGFNYGREKVKETWVRTDHPVIPWGGGPLEFVPEHEHPLVIVKNWGNTQPRRQCDATEPRSNGVVYYIGVKA